MCQIVFIENTSIEIETPKEFEDYFKIKPEIAFEHKDIDPECCLCQVDLEKTFKKHNIEYYHDAGNYVVKTNKLQVMKREIKFKVKNNENNWIYFSIIHSGIDDKKINKNTIGQFVGLKDEYGKEIYEGDIVKFKSIREPNPVLIGKVIHKDASFCIETETGCYYSWIDYEIEVIGNIFDNPELLNQ